MGKKNHSQDESSVVDMEKRWKEAAYCLLVLGKESQPPRVTGLKCPATQFLCASGHLPTDGREHRERLAESHSSVRETLEGPMVSMDLWQETDYTIQREIGNVIYLKGIRRVGERERKRERDRDRVRESREEGRGEETREYGK